MPPAERAAYARNLQAADAVVLCPPRPPASPDEARVRLRARNARLAELIGPDGLLLTVWDGGPSGTAHTVRLAHERGSRSSAWIPEPTIFWSHILV